MIRKKGIEVIKDLRKCRVMIRIRKDNMKDKGVWVLIRIE